MPAEPQDHPNVQSSIVVFFLALGGAHVARTSMRDARVRT